MDDVSSGKGFQFCSEEVDMIKKIQTALKVLQAGEKVKDPAKWKNRAIKTDVVTFLVALVGAASAFGMANIEVSNEEIDAIAESLVAIIPACGILFSTIMHLATSDKVGLPRDGGLRE